MNEAKNLACPFCGKEAEIERPGTARASMIIACTNCGGRMESGDVVGLTPPEQYAWNVRAGGRQPSTSETAETKHVGISDLLAAAELACDKWEWLQAGTREPLSLALARPENEMAVFEMVVTMNNLRSKMQKLKAANARADLPRIDDVARESGREGDNRG